MKVNLKLENNMRIAGTNDSGNITYFDTHPEFGGDNSAATPMEVMLQAMGACSFMDVVSILKKKRKEIVSLNLEIDAERAEIHPKVFTVVHLKFILDSPSAEIKDLERAIEISQTAYCGASAMFQKSGCTVTWEAQILGK